MAFEKERFFKMTESDLKSNVNWGRFKKKKEKLFFVHLLDSLLIST
jgi:polyphosphate kinase 2 (PPK2 family)